MAVKRYKVIPEIAPWCELVDVAQAAGLITELSWDSNGWMLHLYYSLDENPVVAVHSRKRSPECFRSLGLSAAAKLAKL